MPRTTDGNAYAILETIDGRGTVTGVSNYGFIDVKPMQGINFYRLIQVDIDGKERSLGVRTVRVNESRTGIRVYPNPAHGELNIDLGNNNSIRNAEGGAIYKSIDTGLTWKPWIKPPRAIDSAKRVVIKP